MRRLAWAVAIAVVVLGAALAVGSVYSLVAPANPSETQTRLVHIPSGATTASIGDILAEQGIVKNSLAFRIAARYAGYQTGLRAGWYELSPAMTTKAILKTLKSGEVAHFRVTIPEGLTNDQVAERLVAADVGTATEVAAALTQSNLVAEWLPSEADLPSEASRPSEVTGPKLKDPLQGYLFPDTYTFDYGVSADRAVQVMVGGFRSLWTPEMTAQAKADKMSIHQIVTLASIIELETRYPEDRPLVSAVFHNRLKFHMMLDSDVTTAYAVGKPASQLTKSDFASTSPYNTYVAKGLPPGPICNPGLASIQAALAPADVSYLYFVAEPDGHLLYAKNFAEHERNVQKVRSMGGK